MRPGRRRPHFEEVLHMTALAHETPEAGMTKVATPPSDLDDVLWQAWRAMELPEGYHAEIIEGSIEVSPTGRYAHGRIVNELRDRLVVFLAKSEFAARQDINVIHRRKVWIPDLFVVPADAEEYVTEDGLGIDASAVGLVVEVVSPAARASPETAPASAAPTRARGSRSTYSSTTTTRTASSPCSPCRNPARASTGTSSGRPTARPSPFPRGPPRDSPSGWTSPGSGGRASRTGGSASRGPSRSRPPGCGRRPGRIPPRRG